MSRTEVLLLVSCSLVIGVPLLLHLRRTLRAWREKELAELLRERPELADIFDSTKLR